MIAQMDEKYPDLPVPERVQQIYVMERLTFPVITIKYMQVITIVKQLFFRMSGYKEERRMDFMYQYWCHLYRIL